MADVGKDELMRCLRIGLAGFFHHNARGDKAVFERAVSQFQDLSAVYGFEFFYLDFPIYTNRDGERAVTELNQRNVDFSFLFCSSVANGNAVIPFSGLHGGIGLMAVEENTVKGYLPLNSFCGSMVAAGILGSYLKDFAVKFKWFYGYPSSQPFIKRFDATFRALSAIVRLRESRVGVVGPLVEGFDHLRVNPARIKNRFGLTVDRGMEVDELVEMAETFGEEEVQREVESLSEKGRVCPDVTGADMEKFARLFMALSRYAKNQGYDALAVSCWTRLQRIYGAAVCAPVAMMNEMKTITACEADVDGAVSMLADSALHGHETVTMADLVNFDFENQCLNLWHCGPSAPCLADQKGVLWDNHFDIGQLEEGEWHGCGVVSDLQFRPGPVTVCRLNTRQNTLLVFQGEMTQREGYQGSSGWVGKLTMDREELPLKDLLSTLFKNSIDHHLILGYGHHEEAWREFAYWTEVELVKKEIYKNYAY